MTWRTCSTPVPSLGTDSACCWGARAPGKRKVAPQPGLYAALFLPDGKTTGVVRQGATFNRERASSWIVWARFAARSTQKRASRFSPRFDVGQRRVEQAIAHRCGIDQNQIL